MLKETIVKNARYESALRMKIKDKHTDNWMETMPNCVYDTS